MAGDPTNIGHAAEYITLSMLENVLESVARIQEIATDRMSKSFRFPRAKVMRLIKHNLPLVYNRNKRSSLLRIAGGQNGL
jgi:hypothetical protein